MTFAVSMVWEFLEKKYLRICKALELENVCLSTAKPKMKFLPVKVKSEIIGITDFENLNLSSFGPVVQTT